MGPKLCPRMKGRVQEVPPSAWTSHIASLSLSFLIGTMGGQLSLPGGAVLRFRGVMLAKLGQVLLSLHGGQKLPGGAVDWPQRQRAQRALRESLPAASPSFSQWLEPGTRLLSEAGTFEP